MSDKLRDIRKSKGLTLRDFANRIGMPISTLSEIETGRKIPSATERSIIEREIGRIFLTDKFDETGTNMLPLGLCAKEHKFTDALVENKIKNNKEMFDFLKRGYEEDLKKHAESYSALNRMEDLYQRLILAHETNLREDQNNRIAKLKIDMYLVAKTVLNNCPDNRYAEFALEHLEKALDQAIKAIKVEEYTNPPGTALPEEE